MRHSNITLQSTPTTNNCLGLWPPSTKDPFHILCWCQQAPI